MNEIMALLVGVGLAAASGLRVFVPLFITSLIASGNVDMFSEVDVQAMLGDQDWLANPWVTLVLGIATVLEIGSYYIPWLDNALDFVATPAALVAGTFIMGAMLPQMMGDGSLKWITATIAGGGTSGLFQGASVIVRGGSILASDLAIIVPLLGAVLMLILMYFAQRTLYRFFKNRSNARLVEASGRTEE